MTPISIYLGVDRSVSRQIAEDILLAHVTNFTTLSHKIPYQVEGDSVIFLINSEEEAVALHQTMDKTKLQLLASGAFDLMDYIDTRLYAIEQGVQGVLGTGLTDEEFGREISKVTPEFVREVAQEIFVD